MHGLDASWLSGAEEAGKKAFHSCALPWDTDWVTETSPSAQDDSTLCACTHTPSCSSIIVSSVTLASNCQRETLKVMVDEVRVILLKLLLIMMIIIV